MDLIQAGFIAVSSAPATPSYILKEDTDNLLAENNDLLTQE